MQRRIVLPPDLSGSALNQFKQWLGVSTSDEDDLLLGLLHASAELCESFTGRFPIETSVEERIPPEIGQYSLSARPVRTLTKFAVLENDGSEAVFAPDAYRAEINADGIATITIKEALDAQAIVIHMLAGLAPSWDEAPRGLRQGMIRLAAFHYQNRDAEGPPPASVAALWRPWKIWALA